MPFPTLHPAVARALAAQGYAEPTPVQAAVLAATQDSDLLVSAQTGSGKTVAYGLALAPNLLGEGETMGQAGAPAALIVAPTRELAIQVARELAWLYGEAGAVIATCVGGMDPRREQRTLAGGVHIVVGTPGRLRDHLERGALVLSALDAVVLDEADEMLDMGFREDLEALLDAAPPERRTLLFSATIARDIANLARRYQNNAERIDVGSKNEPHGDIEYRAIRIAPNEAEHSVVNILRHIEAPGALVFCATREAVRHLHSALRERGFSVAALSGELTQKERNDALQSLRDGRARVCVATDVAARGLDLPDLGLVIHFDLPTNKAALLHRSGRTGRAGRKGVSVLLVPYNRRRAAESLLLGANIEATWENPPTAESIRAKDQTRLIEELAQAEPATEEELALAAGVIGMRTPEQIAVALVRLHRAGLPSPEELFEERTSRDRPEPQQTFGAAAPSVPFERGEGEAAWFRVKVGRNNDADPKWLIPLICRLGHVTKADIGQIRIFERETKFEIYRAAESRFRNAIASGDGESQIEPAADPGTKPTRRTNDQPDRKGGQGFRGKRFGHKGGHGGGHGGGQGGGYGGGHGDGPRPASLREGGPREGGPREGGPREGGPREGGPREGSPREGGPRDGDSYKATPRKGAPYKAAPREGAPYKGPKGGKGGGEGGFKGPSRKGPKRDR